MPWNGTYVQANGDLTVDLRSNIAAESRAKIVYEYLLKLTDDPLVKDSLRFLMTREIAHFQMFSGNQTGALPPQPFACRMREWVAHARRDGRRRDAIARVTGWIRSPTVGRWRGRRTLPLRAAAHGSAPQTRAKRIEETARLAEANLRANQWRRQ